MRGVELTPDRPADEVADLAVRAEAAGFDTLFASCHYNNRDPFAALPLAPERTDDIRLGPGVANPYELHPVTLAAKTATIAELSGGRGVFGIGPGDPSTLRNLGLSEERGLRSVLEAFRAARRLWAGERLDHEGSFVAEGAGLNFEVPGEIPVYVGGEGPHMCRMAGKHADGLLYNGSHPADLSWARDRVKEGIADREDGDGEGPFDLAAYALVSVAEDGERAHEAARRPVAFVTSGSPPPVLQRHDIDPERAEAIGDAISAGRFGEADDLVTEGMVEAFAAAGTPEEVTARIEALTEHADSIVAGSPLGPDEGALELAAEALERAGL